MSRFDFRAWDDEAGEFTYSFVENDNYIWGFEDGKLKAWAIRLNPGTIDEPPHPESVELEPPEQSTGLPDKTGKEIFEGDVLRETPKSDWEKNNYFLREVFWHDNDCCDSHIGFQMNRHHFIGGIGGCSDFYRFIPRHVKKLGIIGNIYENPELAEAANE